MIGLPPPETPTERARALVAQMTAEEKVSQLMMDSPAIARLNVPAYHWWSEALHGIVRSVPTTVFPQAIGLAATWNTDLMHQVATADSIEARATHEEYRRKGKEGFFTGLTLWSPNVNIFRDPRWGRGQETYGEDPFLTSRMGVAFVTGIQADDPKWLRAVATPKHFAVHSGPEPLRHGFDAQAPERDIFETYLPAFEACVREGHAHSIMSAYSGFNGVPATGNHWLLTDLLREKWGFDGAVVSDVDSVSDLFVGHHVAKDRAEASAMALKAGNDECSGETYKALPEALKRGLVTQADLDRAAIRLFTLRYRLGMFDKPADVPYAQIPISEVDSPAHDALALKAAEESLVLLKNDGILPLDPKKLKRVAVIGPVTDRVAALVGNYNGTPSHPVTLLQGIRHKLEPLGVKVDAAEGSSLVLGLGERTPFPSGTLFTDESRATPGLKGQVFAGTELKDEPIATRTDKNVDLAWTVAQPLAGTPVTDVSIRWTGLLVPPRSGETTFTVSADDGMRLWLDDKLVIDDWHENAERSHSATVTLVQGKPVRIRLEYFQAAGEAAVRFGWSDPGRDRTLLEEATTLAKASDLTILTLGITAGLESEESGLHIEGFSGGDRTSLDLPAPQRALLERLTALGKPVVLVLTSGSAVSPDVSKSNAIIQAWYPGQRGGDALANVLMGDVNPAGRLPVTFYRSIADLPPFESYKMAGRTYRYFGGKPLFPFGYGLSYTRFRYGVPSIVTSYGVLTLNVPIKNIGQRDGDEVLQLYAHPVKRLPGDAIRSLVAFTRISVPKGTTQNAMLRFNNQSLRVWDPTRKDYVVRPGDYELEIGPSSSEIRIKNRITISQTEARQTIR
ncbi:glycoside hydrolase family 3 protein [soil metagenome]